MQTAIETITPALAKIMLGMNTQNRKLKKNHVQNMVRDIQNGLWQLNGSSICVCSDGTLLDGQHRLHAIIKADKSIETIVVRGLPKDARDTIDSGTKRTVSDRISMNGASYATSQSSVANFLISVAHNTPRSVTASQQEVLSVIENHDLIPSCTVADKAFPRVGTLLAGLHYIACYQDNHQKADEFIAVFKKGVPTYEHDAAHFCREYFIAQEMKQVSIRTEFKRRIIVNAFNKFIMNEPMRSARFPEKYYIPQWTPECVGVHIG